MGVNGFIVEKAAVLLRMLSILAKSFGITAIFNVSDILNKIKNGKKVIVDCRSNIVIINPSKKDIENYTILTENIKRYKEQSIIDIKEKAITKDGIEIKVNANIRSPEETESLLKYEIDSIGLYRTEFLYIFSDINKNENSVFPSEEVQFKVYKNIASKIKGKIIIRTLDIAVIKCLPLWV